MLRGDEAHEPSGQEAPVSEHDERWARRVSQALEPLREVLGEAGQELREGLRQARAELREELPRLREEAGRELGAAREELRGALRELRLEELADELRAAGREVLSALEELGRPGPSARTEDRPGVPGDGPTAAK